MEIGLFPTLGRGPRQAESREASLGSVQQIDGSQLAKHIGGLAPYLTHVMAWSRETKELRGGSFLLSCLRRAQKEFFNISYSISSWY